MHDPKGMLSVLDRGILPSSWRDWSRGCRFLQLLHQVADIWERRRVFWRVPLINWDILLFRSFLGLHRGAATIRLAIV